ncbi:DUF1150 family protein [Aestuariivirga litoralis]|uniref:DUF1150 family protein n=1 Tax=Aestuariivirga litoralis TaxID=2650924 RepID=UPI0018C7EF28|nr:DUF1150 family protein [Aestuariivirga litoralis]MBG1232863.1 DUF1150 family protein [Aestuariivirga litoralis]
MENKSHTTVSPEQLQAIGAGLMAYVKPMDAEDASRLLGQTIKIAPGEQLFGLFNANGAPISISQSIEDAVGSALEHELMPSIVN